MLLSVSSQCARGGRLLCGSRRSVPGLLSVGKLPPDFGFCFRVGRLMGVLSVWCNVKSSLLFYIVKCSGNRHKIGIAPYGGIFIV